MTRSETSLPARIPREVLFGNPRRTQPRISPDGERLAYLAPVNGVLNVCVGPVGGLVGSDDFRPVTNDTNRGIRVFFWAEDDRHLLYLQDVGGDEDWRLYAVELPSGDTRDLTPFEKVQVRITDLDKSFPDELLVSMNKESPQVHDVYRLRLSSGELELVAKNPGNVAGWVTDAGFRVRGALAATPEGGFDLLVRESEEGEWEKLIS